MKTSALSISNLTIDLKALPLNLRNELIDFYEFLIQKYEQQEITRRKNIVTVEELFGKYKHIH